MGCFEDFIELREAAERLKKERRRELKATAKDGRPKWADRGGQLHFEEMNE